MIRTSLVRSSMVYSKQLIRVPLMAQLAVRSYYPGDVLMKRQEGEYFADPVSVAERVVRLIALHDHVNDPSAITLNCSFEQLGLNSLDL